MGKNNKKCPRCGHKMKQQFIGLQHCSCGMSWKGGTGFFDRTPDMVFCLRRQKGSAKQSICIETRQDNNTISKYNYGSVREIWRSYFFRRYHDKFLSGRTEKDLWRWARDP